MSSLPPDPDPKTRETAAVPIALLVCLGVVGPLAIHLAVPALPSIARSFDTDYARVQLLVSFYILAYGAGQIVVGPMADQFGRRRVLLTGLAVFATASILCPLAPSIEVLIGLRIVQGFSACTGIVLARTIVRDLYSGFAIARMLGYLAMGAAIGPMVAPALGGWIYETAGWQAIFLALTAFAALLTALSVRFVPETLARSADPATIRRVFRDLGILLRSRDFRLFGACICFNTSMFYCFVVGGPYVAGVLGGMTPAEYGRWFALIAIGYAAGNFVSSRIGYRFRNETLVIAGALLVAVSVALPLVAELAGVGSVPLLFSFMSGATFASGLMMPNATAGALGGDPRRAGAASGGVGFFQFAFAAAFSSLTGVLVQGGTSAIPMLTVMLAVALAGVASALLLRWRVA